VFAASSYPDCKGAEPTDQVTAAVARIAADINEEEDERSQEKDEEEG
jgi:hypothetical protein